MDSKNKMRKLTIKVRRSILTATSPELIRELILDNNRVRKCRVKVERLRPRLLNKNGNNIEKDLQTRRCCVRIPRINMTARSELSSTPASSIVRTDSFTDNDDFKENDD